MQFSRLTAKYTHPQNWQKNIRMRRPCLSIAFFKHKYMPMCNHKIRIYL